MGVVLLDNNAIVGFLDATDKYHQAADTRIRELAREHWFVISAVTYGEVLTGARLGHRDESVVHEFVDRFIYEVAPVTREIADRAAWLRASKAKPKMPDALILATAEAYPADRVLGAETKWSKIPGYGLPYERLKF